MYSVLVVTFRGNNSDRRQVESQEGNFIGNFRSYFRGGVHRYGSDDVGYSSVRSLQHEMGVISSVEDHLNEIL
jgi:hypothetical protein